MWWFFCRADARARAHPAHRCVPGPSGIGLKTLWLVGFAPAYYTLFTFLVSILSSPPLSSRLPLSQYSTITIGSLPDGCVVPFVHEPLYHCVKRTRCHCILMCSTSFFSWTTRLTWLRFIATMPGVRSTITCK